MRSFPYIITLFVALLLGSCIKYEQVEVIGVEDVTMNKFSTSGVEVEISIRVNNPNNYKITIVNSDLDIYVKGKRAGKAKITNRIVIPKNSRDVHKIKVKANYNELMGALTGNILGLLTGGSTELRIKGEITAKAKMLRKKFPVDFKKRVDLKGLF